MNNYELLYILPANMAGKEIKTVFQDIEKDILKMGGEKLETLLDHPFLIKAETARDEESEELKDLPIVKRKLAYLVKKNKFGFYCLFNFKSEPKDIAEIETYLRMNKNVLRHLITQVNPMSKEERKELEKLFTRKRAEQEKEKRDVRKKEKKEEEEKEVKKEVKKPQEIKTTELPKKEGSKKIEVEEKTEEKLEKIKKETEKKDEKKVEKADSDEKEISDKKTKKKKMKLEDLEDKLDKILEDTNI